MSRTVISGSHGGFPCSSVSKESMCNAGDGFNPWVGKICRGKWQCSSVLAWEISGTEVPGGPCSMGLQELDTSQQLNHRHRGSCCCCWVTLVVSDSVWPHRRQPPRLPHPWGSPGKNTGEGCHFLLQCMKVKSESEVAQSCPTLSDPMDCSLPGSSAHGIFQARVPEWGAIAFSDGGRSFV